LPRLFCATLAGFAAARRAVAGLALAIAVATGYIPEAETWSAATPDAVKVGPAP
jgi:hypothetical protein